MNLFQFDFKALTSKEVKNFEEVAAPKKKAETAPVNTPKKKDK
jgi:hypothetical protein